MLVRPREKLPLEAGLERRERGKRAGPVGVDAEPAYPRLANPYALASVPFIDQTFGLDMLHGADARQVDTAYTAYLTADLLGTQAALFASRSLRDRQSGTLRLTLGRHDPDAGLLGPLRARTVQAGSIQVPGIENISFTNATGNGITVGNRPLDQPTRFDRHSLQGDLPPGWDVELYYNEALVGFQQSRADGKYSFDDQPLAYGPNDFRLVFHGPLGQLRIERRSFLLEQSAVAPGSVYYDVSTHRDAEGRNRSVARFDWGVANFLSASGALARVPLAGVERRYSQLGLHSYWQSFILSGEVAQEAGGGRLGQVTLKTRLAGLALSASRARLADFTSETYSASADPVRMRDELRVDGAVSAPGLPVLPVSLQVRRDTLASMARAHRGAGPHIGVRQRRRTEQFGALAIDEWRPRRRWRAAAEPARRRLRHQRPAAVRNPAALRAIDPRACVRPQPRRRLPGQPRRAALVPGRPVPGHRRTQQEPRQLRPGR